MDDNGVLRRETKAYSILCLIVLDLQSRKMHNPFTELAVTLKL